MLEKPFFPNSCCKMDSVRKQAIYWHWVCINTVMIFMLSVTANCKVRCQFKQRYYLVLFCWQVFISSLSLTELEGCFEKKVWNVFWWVTNTAGLAGCFKLCLHSLTSKGNCYIWKNMDSWHRTFLLKLALEILSVRSVVSEAKLKITVTLLQVWQLCRWASCLEAKSSVQSLICLFTKGTSLIFFSLSQECESLNPTFFLCSQTLSISPGKPFQVKAPPLRPYDL